jgi:hypothetical protein
MDLGISMLKERYKSFIEVPPHKNNAGKKVFVNRSLCSTKTCLQGYNKRLKKISTPRYASGSIFLAALAGTAATLRCCAPAHSATFRLVLTPDVAVCFVSHGRSFLIRGYSCPP